MTDRAVLVCPLCMFWCDLAAAFNYQTGAWLKMSLSMLYTVGGHRTEGCGVRGSDSSPGPQQL